MKPSYLELEISSNNENHEAIYNHLYIEGINTFLEENGIIKIYFPETDFKNAEKIKNDLIHKLNITHSNIHLAKFENHNWNKEWEKTIGPVYIKDKIIIFPSWKKSKLKNTKGRILIQIDPKMSFGTGHNESTQLILEIMMDYMDEKDNYMLDYGCGTGILSIAGVKLGLNKVIAIDTNNDAIENAKENFEINGVSENTMLNKADITEINETNFDVISANISIGVISANLKNIYNKLKTGRKLFATGILTEEKDEFAEHLGNNNFSIVVIKEKADWAGFYCIKK
ncbi:MAG: 50S ribosomal protein L11 methyltransferase [Chlorobi bacterium]|nr:50S ribosomal protein L11 methyltransferase [Chlorobiota bacterium]MCI0715301.1 50S ribosomal protein L11 methyltransferase [Chlorobiota bacterium]